MNSVKSAVNLQQYMEQDIQHHKQLVQHKEKVFDRNKQMEEELHRIRMEIIRQDHYKVKAEDQYRQYQIQLEDKRKEQTQFKNRVSELELNNKRILNTDKVDTKHLQRQVHELIKDKEQLQKEQRNLLKQQEQLRNELFRDRICYVLPPRTPQYYSDYSSVPY